MASSRDDKKNKERRNLARKFADDQEKSSSASCVQAPEGVEFLKLKANKEPLQLDFLPFIAGKNNTSADEGEEAIRKTYELHWVPTLSNKNRPVACRAYCFGKKCAVCDWLRNNGGKADEEFVKNVRVKRRHLWVVTDKIGSKDPPFKLLDTSDKNKGMGFAELMVDAVNALKEDMDPFSLESGCTASIIVKEQTGGTFKFEAATRIDFRDRDYDYPSDLVNQTPCLDDLIVDPGYDEVMEVLEPSVRSTKDEEKPSRKSVSGPSPSGKEDKDDVDQELSKGELSSLAVGCKVIHESKVKTIKKVASNGKLDLEDEDGLVDKHVDPDEVELFEGDTDQEEETPQKVSRR